MCITITYNETRSKRRNLFLVTMSIMVFAALISICHTTNLTYASVQDSDNKRKFIINVNLVDDLNGETNSISFDTVDIYVKEYPRYGIFGIDLDDAMYSNSNNGDYSTKIVIPSGLIDVNEVFHICLEEVDSDEVNDEKHCYELKNMPQKAPEIIKILV
ncbi:MAG: hypothetical protein AB7U98_15045 [Candidatus Nitrosocosmicus sp.]|nr:hypothetical protein [Candidatus Nitrosocosmicus sp.]